MSHNIQELFSDGCAPITAFGTKRRSVASNQRIEGETEMDKLCQLLTKVEEFSKRLDSFELMLSDSISEQKAIRGEIAYALKQLKKEKADK